MSMEKRLKALGSMSKIFNEILVSHANKTKQVAEEVSEPEEPESDEKKKEKSEAKAPFTKKE